MAEPSSLKTRGPLAIAFALAAFFVFLGPSRSPMIWIDEVFYGEAGRALLNGRLSAPIFAGLRGLDSSFHFQPPVFPGLLSAAYSALGVTPLATRLPAALSFLAVGLIIASLLAPLARREGLSPWLPLVGASLLWFDPWLLSMARSGRPDMLAVVLAFGAIKLAGGEGVGRLLGVGALAGLAGLVHPVVGLAAAGLLASKLWPLSGGSLRRALWICAGLGSVLLPWAAWVASDFEAWNHQFLGHVAGAASIADSSGQNHRPVALRPFAHLYAYFRVMPATLLLCALVLRPRRLRATGMPALLGVSGVLVLCLLAAENFSKFLVPFAVPLLALAWARAASDATGRRRSLLRGAAGLALLNLLALCVLKTGVVVMQWDDRDPARLDALVARHATPGDPILVMPEVWYAALNNGNRPLYWSPLRGLRVTPTEDERASLYTRLRAEAPTVLIADAGEDVVAAFAQPAGACVELLEELTSDSVVLGASQRTIYGLKVWSVDWACSPEEPAD